MSALSLHNLLVVKLQWVLSFVANILLLLLFFLLEKENICTLSKIHHPQSHGIVHFHALGNAVLIAL